MDFESNYNAMKFPLFTLAILLTFAGLAQERKRMYDLGPDSHRQEGVPQGEVTRHVIQSKEWREAHHEYYVYVPAQYDPKAGAGLMVFQDGHWYLNEEGDARTTIVYDNLIHQGKVPVTICIFINPGHSSDDFPENPFRNQYRVDQYDEMSDRYVSFLINELIPEVEKEYNIIDDPKHRAICGMSSGGICAFTAAWQRPDYFHKVVSHIGSFTNIRGGHEYPNMIRSVTKKDIKVFLQDGENDLDLVFGNWWLANKQMESSLKFRDYDYKFVGGKGGHSGEHGGAILPETLIWLWSDIMEK